MKTQYKSKVIEGDEFSLEQEAEMKAKTDMVEQELSGKESTL